MAGTEYVVVNDQVCIVEPNTYEIIEIIQILQDRQPHAAVPLQRWF